MISESDVWGVVDDEGPDGGLPCSPFAAFGNQALATSLVNGDGTIMLLPDTMSFMKLSIPNMTSIAAWGTTAGAGNSSETTANYEASVLQIDGTGRAASLVRLLGSLGLLLQAHQT